jgi:putative phosphoesterase
VRIGVVSDTHGYVDPRLLAALAGVDAILHAGDVGGTHVVEALAAVAPLHAVYGNNDEKLGGLGLPFRIDVTLGGALFHVVHQLPHATPPQGAAAVVYGHSHRPAIEQRGAVIYLNPGAAGRAGFHSLQTFALLDVDRGRIEARIVELGAREVLARAPRTRAPRSGSRRA